MSTEFDCEFTDEVVCPHCGHSHTDSWEWLRDDPALGDGSTKDVECGKCDKPIRITIHFSIYYSAEKIEAKDDKLHSHPSPGSSPG